MRYVIALAILLLATPAWAACAFVQSTQGVWTSGTSFTASITATNGHLLVVSVFVHSDGSDFYSSTSDGASNTYSSIDSLSDNISGAFFHTENLYVKNMIGGSLTITVSLTGTPVDARILVHEYSGADTTAPLDVHKIGARQDNPGTGTDALTSTSVTTTTNGQCVVGFTHGSQDFTSVGAVSAGTGYTGRESVLNRVSRSEDQIQSSSGSIAATFTSPYSDINTRFWTGIATFKAAAGGGTVGTNRHGKAF